jgi:regulation of enolase protein 1 (concanavalin A-like superfamily)
MKLTLFAVLLILVSSPRVRAQETVALGGGRANQDQSGSSFFSWINKQKDYRILSDDSVSITASKETDLFNDAESGSVAGNAPMLAFTPDDAFVLTAKATPDFKSEFDGGFLVVYVDQTHWAKLLFEKSHYGPFSVGSSVTNTYSDDSVNADIPGKEVYLRVTKSKEVFAFYYSLDGVKWRYIRFFRFPSKGQLRIGFASQSPSGDQCTTVFSKIVYVPKASRDFWTGEPPQAATCAFRTQVTLAMIALKAA